MPHKQTKHTHNQHITLLLITPACVASTPDQAELKARMSKGEAVEKERESMARRELAAVKREVEKRARRVSGGPLVCPCCKCSHAICTHLSIHASIPHTRAYAHAHSRTTYTTATTTPPTAPAGA